MKKKLFDLKTSSEMSSIEQRRLMIGKQLGFAASEAYKLLRTNLIFSLADEQKCKVIGVTSAVRGEGKSTTSINVAYSLAQAQKNVLLIEADMRIPVASKVMNIKKEVGLSHVLAGVGSLNDAITWSAMDQETLAVITAGEIPPNPSELLSSARMEQLISSLSEHFDYIIVDMPPITAVSDALTISGIISGMIVVVRKDYCDQAALAETMRQLKFLDVKVLGFVLNGVDVGKKIYKRYGRYGKYGKYRKGYYSKYYYSNYAYSSKPEK